jgi:hypothetical protein
MRKKIMDFLAIDALLVRGFLVDKNKNMSLRARP